MIVENSLWPEMPPELIEADAALTEALGNVMIADGNTFTLRELQVGMLAGEDKSVEQTAGELFIASNTVKSHRERATKKSHAKSIHGLVYIMYNSGLIPYDAAFSRGVHLDPVHALLIKGLSLGEESGEMADRKFGFDKGEIKSRVKTLGGRVGASKRPAMVARTFALGLQTPAAMLVRPRPIPLDREKW